MLFRVFMLLSLLYAATAHGQEFVCGYYPSDDEVSGQTSHIDYRNSTAANPIEVLILFGRFQGQAGLPNLRTHRLTERDNTTSRNIRSAHLVDPTVPSSLAHYFEEMSYGNLHLTSADLAAQQKWYEGTSEPTWTPNSCTINTWADSVEAFVTEVLENADADGVSFADADVVAVFTPPGMGDREECSFNGTVLSSRTGFSWIASDGTVVGRVITSDWDHRFPFMVGVLAHEYGHVMDLDELYDRTHARNASAVEAEHSAGVGYWGVMGRGANGYEHLGEGIADGPAPMTAWSRIEVGWLDGRVNTVSSDENVTLPDLNSDTGEVVVRVEVSDDEYFLLSNRQRGATGSYYDDYAPASGLLIWHVDESAQRHLNDANEFEEHKRVDVECADGLFTDRGSPGNSPDSTIGGDNLDFWSPDSTYRVNHNGNQGDAGDMWTSGDFAPDTNPSTDGYSGSGSSAQQTEFTGIAIRNIRQDDATGVVTVKIRFIPDAPTGLSANTTATENQVVLSWTTPDVNEGAISGYQYSYTTDEGEIRTWTAWTGIRSSTATTTTATINDLDDADKATYTFKVRAVTANNEQGLASNEASVVFDRAGAVTLGLPTGKTLEMLTVGDQLTATLSDANDVVSGTPSWQWQRTDDDAADGWTNIGTNMNSYTVVTADVGEQVRATVSYTDGLGAGKSAESDPTGEVPNRAPVFTKHTISVSAYENNTAVYTYMATDPDGHMVKWSLGGDDAGLFSIGVGADSGQLTFKTAPNYEDPRFEDENKSLPVNERFYKVTVIASDDFEDDPKSVEVEVKVLVADMFEKPGKPTLTLAVPETNGHTTLNARWTVENTGPPAKYKLTWCATYNCSSTTRTLENLTDTSQPLTGLIPETEYSVYVRASSDEGIGEWSEEATATTAAAPNSPPVVAGEQAPSVNENDTVVGTYTATDKDKGDTITWSLGESNKTLFTIGTSTGALSFQTAPDFEALPAGHAGYAVEVIAGDSTEATTYPVTVSVADVDEPPPAPTLTVAVPSTNGDTTLDVRWTPPDTTGIPAISGYTLETCSGHCKDFTSTNWTPQTLTGTSTTLTDLTPSTQYFARVRAHNDEGDGAWSVVRSAYTQAAPDRPPKFTAGPTDPTVDENTTRVGKYAATDPDGDPITWSLEGTNAPALELVGTDTTRTLQFKTAPNFEEKSRYSVTVKVSSSAGEGEGGGGTPLSATRPVTVTINDMNEVGHVRLSTTQPVVGKEMTITLEDEDNPTGVTFATYGFYVGLAAGAVGTATDSVVVFSANASDPDTVFTPGAELIGFQLYFRATYTDNHGAQSRSSDWTQPVRPPACTAPTALASPAQTASSIDLTWSAPSPACYPTEYQYRYQTEGGGWSPWKRTDRRSQTVPNLTANTSYTLAVRAKNGAGDGPAAQITVQTRQKDTLGRVGLSTTTPQQGKQIKATLTDPDNPTNVNGHWLYFSAVGTEGTKVDPSEVSATNGTPPTWSLTPSNVLVGIRLQARVFYDDDHGTNKSVTSVKTEPVLPRDCGAPSLTATAQSTSSIRLTWTAPSPNCSPTGYQYRYKQTEGGSWTSWTSASSGLTVSGLTASTSYTFAVRAVNAAGEGSAATDTVRTPDPPPTCTAPRAPTATAQSTSSIRLTWSAPSPNCSPTGYQYRYKASGGSWTSWTSAGTSSQTVSGLSASTRYTLEVRATNASGTGTAAQASARTPDPPPPICSAPGQLKSPSQTT